MGAASKKINMNILDDICTWADEAAAGMAEHWSLARTTVDRDVRTSFATLLVAIGDRKHDSALPGVLARVLQELNQLGGAERVMNGTPLSTSRDNLPLAAAIDCVLAQLFGGRIDYVESMMGSGGAADIAARSRMLRQCALLTTAFLGQHICMQGGCLSDVTNRISGDHDVLVGRLPARLAAWYGASCDATPHATPVARPTSRSVWPWVLLVVMFAFAALAVWRAGAEVDPPVFHDLGRTPPAATAGFMTEQSTARVGVYDPVLGFFGDLLLPNDTELFVPRFGVENKLVAFVEDSSMRIDQNAWLNLDRLAFESDSDELAPGSDEQLQNLAQILGAFPALKLKVAGYDDDTGPPEKSMARSTTRARNVVAALVALGVEANRLQSAGYGQEHPVATNTTAEGRARNRRVDINVVAK